MSARSCPACGGPRAELRFSDRNRREGLDIDGRYLRCVGCGTLYLEQVPDPATLAQAYASGTIDEVPDGPLQPADGTAAPLSGARALLRAAMRAVAGRPHSEPEEPGRGRRLLDFGCLSGDKLVEFHQRGWQVAGVDLNEKAIARARARIPSGSFHAGPLATLPRSETFDVIRTDNVIEHLPDPLEILADLRTHLKDGGRLLVYVPNGDGLSLRLLGGGSVNSWIPYHLQLFSRRGLAALLRRAGFSSVRIRFYSPLAWWRQTARQTVAAPGYAHRPPGVAERAAIAGAVALTPLWLATSRTPLAEELVADARG